MSGQEVQCTHPSGTVCQGVGSRTLQKDERWYSASCSSVHERGQEELLRLSGQEEDRWSYKVYFGGSTKAKS